MIEALLQQLAGRITGSTKGEAAARQLYLDINISGLEDENEEGKAASFDKHKDAILPVLIKDCSGACEDLQRGGLEMLGHLAGMAEWISPFQPHQAAALWSAVARVLHDEAQGKLSKIAALFAISNQTMGHDLMETSAPLLAPAVATSMRHASAVVRKQAALAVLSLLRDAPLGMATCAIGSRGAIEENGSWAPCLLRLCLDDCFGVRVEALKAAKLAVACLRGQEGVAEWVLGTLKDGTLFRGMDRIMFHQEGSPRGASPTTLSTRAPPLTEPNVSQPSTAGCTTATAAAAATAATPSPKTAKEARVKHAIKVWAIFLSLADLTSLLQTRGTSKNTFELATNKLLKVASGFSDKRAQVRAEAVEAWEMFVSNCLGKFKREEAAKVAELSLRPFVKRALREKDPFVRGVVLSSLARCVSSFPSQSVKYLWRLPQKHQQEGRIGMADLLRKAAGDGSGEDARHFCARMLAALLPCLHPSRADAHPCLQQSGLDITEEVSPLLSTLQTLMRAFPAPSPEVAAARVGPAATSTESEPHTPSDAPVDALPTSGLIVRAWCGLALWALSEHRRAVSSSAGCGGGGDGGGIGVGAGVGVGAGAGAGGDGDAGGCSTSGGGKKGHGTLSVSAQGKTPPPAHKKKTANKESPLTIILRSLFSRGTTPQGGFQGDHVAVKKDVGVSASSGKVVGSEEKPVATAATAASLANLADWRPALLAALVRALVRLNLSTGSGGGPNEDNQGTERIRELLEARVVAFSPSLDSESGRPICSGCAQAEDVDGIILRGQNEGVSGGGGKGGNDTGGCSGDAEEVGARGSSLWLTLLAGVLRERCDCHKPDAKSPSSTCRRGDRHMDEDARPYFARQTHSPVSPVDDRFEGAGGTNHTLFPSASLLPELLTLAPKEGAARVLSSLSTAVADLSGESKSSSSTCPDRAKNKAGTDNVWNSLARKRSSTLLALGHMWHAEAARILSAWKSVGISSPEGGGSVDRPLDSSQRAQGGLKRRVASPNPVGSTDAQPSDRLLGDTANTLQSLLKTASLVSRSPASTWEPTCYTGGSAEEVGSAVLKHDCGAGGCAVGGVGGFLEAEKEGRLPDDEVGALPCSQGSFFNAVDAAIGAEAADLWRRLFDARQDHPPGFSSLLRKIAKDCAALALSGPSGAVVGPTPREDGSGLTSQVPPQHDGNSKGWTLAFSQTQAQRSRREDKSGNNRRRGASVNEGQNDTARNAKRDGLQEQHLAPPPPFSCLPVLTAAALALLRATPKEANSKSRTLAWGAGLATLAWILTSTLPARPTPLPASAATPPPARKKGGGHSPETPSRTAASVMADGVITEIRECLVVARGVVSSGSKERRPPRAIFPLDEDSLSALSRLLAVGIGRSGDGAQCVVSGGRARRTSPAQASCVAVVPAVSEGVRGLALSVVSAVKGFSPDELGSPDLLPALSPMLEAALEIPRSRPTDALQCAVIDMWNNTFGSLSMPEWKMSVFPRGLRRCLSDMATLMDIKMPFGIALEEKSGLDLPKLSQVSREQEAMLSAAENVQEHPQNATLGSTRLGARSAKYALPGSGNDVAGALPTASARRSFMRQRPSSPPSCEKATPRKRPPSTLNEAATTGGAKFVRVIGGARGGSRTYPTKRAAVTTYTSLDGSQAPWDDGSQLPDSELDSEPALPEEDIFPGSGLPLPLPPSKYAPPLPSPSLADGNNNPSPGKRGREGLAADPAGASSPPAEGMAVDTPNPASNAGVSGGDKTSDRRVRPRTAVAAIGTVEETELETPPEASQERDVGRAARGIIDETAQETPPEASRERGVGTCQDGDASQDGDVSEEGDASEEGDGEGAARDTAEDDRLAATMAAIAKESSASVGDGGHRDSGSEEEGGGERLQRGGRDRGVQRGVRGKGSDGVDGVVQDVMRLTRSLKAARPSMTSEQLEEVDSLLRQTLKDVHEREDEDRD